MKRKRRHYYIVMRSENPDVIISTRRFCPECYPPADLTENFIIREPRWKDIFPYMEDEELLPDAPDCDCDKKKKAESEKSKTY